MSKFPHYRQFDEMSCGPTCLRIVAKFFGRTVPQATIEKLTYLDRTGASLLALCDAAESLAMRARPMQVSYSQLMEYSRFPFVAHWRQAHFLVVYKLTNEKAYVSDPAACGLMTISRETFERHWASMNFADEAMGVVLFLEPNMAFSKDNDPNIVKPGTDALRSLIPHIKQNRKLLNGLLFTVFSISTLIFCLPFLSQAIIDQGVLRNDLSFIYLVAGSQIAIYCGITISEVIRGWLLLYMSSRIHISLLTEFVANLLRLPMSYFERKNQGDVLERLNDHEKIREFITVHAFNAIYGVVSLVTFSIALALYSSQILAVFMVGVLIYFFWTLSFMKRRKVIDYKLFNEMAQIRANEIELVQGIAEIKLAGAEREKRWMWEGLQAQIFTINVERLRLEQWQQSGAMAIINVTLVTVSVIAALNVVSGSMTLGMLLAIGLIMGQLNGPLTVLVDILKSAQDAGLSLARAAEIHTEPKERGSERSTGETTSEEIRFEHVSFRYGDKRSDYVLNDISFSIPPGGTVAIVGQSGSGKTTLLKLLMQFFEPEQGRIMVGSHALNSIPQRNWRPACGAVLQDGFVFSDTIARNVALGETAIDPNQLAFATEIAQAREFIEQKPLSYNTRIGAGGQGLSGGQKQRLLIARAVYKKPSLLLLDEGTSALDANTERKIVENIEGEMEGVSKVIVAHRLSTVKNADEIIVLDAGRIVERGSHIQLIKKRGLYFSLIQNQLELGL